MRKRLALLAWFCACMSFAAVAEGRAYATPPAGVLTNDAGCEVTVDGFSVDDEDAVYVEMNLTADCQPVEEADMIAIAVGLYSDTDAIEYGVCFFAGTSNCDRTEGSGDGAILLGSRTALEALFDDPGPWYVHVGIPCVVAGEASADAVEAFTDGVAACNSSLEPHIEFESLAEFRSVIGFSDPSPFGDTSAVGDVAIDVANFVMGVLLPALLIAAAAGAILRLIFKAVRRVVSSV